MKSVGSLLEHHIQNRAAIVAELGAEAIVLQLEFLHDFHGRLVVHIAITAFTLLRSADGTSVEAHFRSRVSLTIRNKICSTGIIVLYTSASGFGYATGKKNQSKHAAVIKRNIAHVFICDIRPEVCAFGVEERRRLAHFNRHVYASRSESEINRGLLVYLQNDVGLFLTTESWRFGTKHVCIWAQGGQKIKPLGVRLGGSADVRADVGDGDRRIPNDGAALVGYRSANLRGVTGLPPSRRR